MDQTDNYESRLADIVIDRLNKLIENVNVRKDVSRLINTRVTVSAETANHPTIQVQGPSNEGMCECGAILDGRGCVFCKSTLGMLGILNGMVGIIPEGKRKGWGFITAEFDDKSQLVKFQRSLED
jgi:hypothetical protein